MTSPVLPDAAALLRLERALMDAIRARYRPGLEACLAEEFELRVPGSPPAHREQFIAGVLGIPGVIESVDSVDVRATVFGDVGVLTGQQHARVRLDDGAMVADVQVFTDIARWSEGSWRLVLAHSAPLSQA